MPSPDFSGLSASKNLLNSYKKVDVETNGKVVVQGPFGVHDTMRSGMRSVAYDLAPQHPLQSSLQTVFFFSKLNS